MTGIYQHFHPEEHDFIDRASDWIKQVEERGIPYVTHFLTPREVTILMTLTNTHSMQAESYPAGGEYVKVLLQPDGYQSEEKDFNVALLEISYNNKFHQLTHSQILGTFLGETGLKRREIGDIFISADRAQIVVTAHLVAFFLEAITHIASSPVTLKEVPFSQKLSTVTDEKTATILVSSLRLDKVLSSALNISRNLSVNMIQSGRIKLNFVVCDSKDSLLSSGDLLSIRGLGRIRLGETGGLTKKGKLKLKVFTLLNHKK